MKKPQTVVIIVDAPCPLCHRDDTSGPYTCKRCSLEVCRECTVVSAIGLDKNKRRVLCKPCEDATEAEIALEALEGQQQQEEHKKEEQKELTERQLRRLIERSQWPTLPDLSDYSHNKYAPWPGTTTNNGTTCSSK